MKPPLLLILATLLSVACAHRAQAPPAARPPIINMSYASEPTTREPPRFAFATEKAAALLELPPLHRVSLPEGVEELRVWTGFGLALPHRLLRLTRTESGVRG